MDGLLHFVSPLTPRKYMVLNGNFVFDFRDFDLRDVFQERNPGVKLELPVLSVVNIVWTLERIILR